MNKTIWRWLIKCWFCSLNFRTLTAQSIFELPKMCEDSIEYFLASRRYAAMRAADELLSIDDRANAARVAKVYDIVIAKRSAALLDEFDHHWVTVQ